jgi:hypothetical protein
MGTCEKISLWWRMETEDGDGDGGHFEVWEALTQQSNLQATSDLTFKAEI